MNSFRLSSIIGLGGLLLCMSSLGCKKPIEIPEGETAAAVVDDRSLWLSDIEKIIHPESSSQDSLALATAYIDKWVRDQLMTNEAERLYSDDDEIDRLVEDYKRRLLGFRLEEKIISERFDTTISAQEMSTFYEEMKSQFILREYIYRGLYVKFKKDQDGLRDFRQNWKNEQIEDVHNFALAFAEEYHSDTSAWLTKREIDNWYPRWSSRKVDNKEIQSQSDDEYEYFLKIVDREAKGEVSPLAYIEEQLERMLLHRRRGQVLEDYKQELYERALNNNLIKLP